MSGHILKKLLLACIAILLLGASAHAELSVGKYSFVKAKQISWFTFEYTYRAKILNDTENRIHASAAIVDTPGFIDAVDGQLSFGSVEPGDTVKSYDTFTLKGSILVPFYLARVKWAVDTTVVPLDGDDDGMPDEFDICGAQRITTSPTGADARPMTTSREVTISTRRGSVISSSSP